MADNTELFDGFCNRVRSLLDKDKDQLTDDKINSYDISTVAKKYIDNYVGIDEPTDDQQEQINSCYVYKTCLNIIPSLTENKVKLVQTSHAKREYFSNSLDRLEEYISELMSNTLLLLKGDNTTIDTDYFFNISNEDERYVGGDW